MKSREFRGGFCGGGGEVVWDEEDGGAKSCVKGIF